MEWTTACPDWGERLKNRQSIIPPPLFPEVADEALESFNELRIADLPGSPTIGESCLQWVKDICRVIFGAYNPDTGRQEINQIYIQVAKKNSKSTIAAAIMLLAETRNWRRDAELFTIGPTKEIAENAFKPIRSMIDLDPELDAMLQVQPHIKTITHRVSKAALKVLAAEADTVGGKKTSYLLVDELHEFGKKRNAENMLLEIEGGLASRPEGFVIYLTTASEAPPAGIFKQKLDYARKVRDGIIEDKTFLPIIYEYPPDMIKSEAYLDPENWYIPNPNLGKSVSMEFLLQRFKQAKERGREALDTFLAKHLNVEIGLNRATDGWVGADLWEDCARLPRLSLHEMLDMSEIATIGIDGGGLDDLLAMCVIGRGKEAVDGVKPWYVWAHAWATEQIYERRKSIVPMLDDFERDGDLSRAGDIIEAWEQVADVCVQVKNSGKLHLLGMDNFKAIADALEILTTAGIEEKELCSIHQGSKLMTAIVAAEAKLSAKTMWHSNQPLLNWCVGNAKVEPRGNAIMITKQAAGTAKIDALMAMLMATQTMADNPQLKTSGSIDDWLNYGSFDLVGS